MTKCGQLWSTSYILPLKTRGERLRQLISLLGVSNAKGVEVTAAPNLKLGDGLRLLDLHRAGVLAARLLEKVADVVDLFRLKKERKKSVRCRDFVKKKWSCVYVSLIWVQFSSAGNGQQQWSYVTSQREWWSEREKNGGKWRQENSRALSKTTPLES